MNRTYVTGDDVLIPGIGVVNVVQVYPSGAALVIDGNGKRWVLEASMMKTAEHCLFSHLPY